MKKINSIYLYVLIIICTTFSFIFSSINANAFENYTNKDMKRMENLINETYITMISVLDTKSIDMINKPLNAHDLTKFGVYYLYINRNEKLEKTEGECIVPMKMVHRIVKNVLDYHLTAKQMKEQKFEDLKITDKDIIILSMGDAGGDAPLEIQKITRDDIGLIRVQAIQKYSDDPKEIFRYKIVLKERLKNNKLSWSILLFKEI